MLQVLQRFGRTHKANFVIERSEAGKTLIINEKKTYFTVKCLVSLACPFFKKKKYRKDSISYFWSPHLFAPEENFRISLSLYIDIFSLSLSLFLPLLPLSIYVYIKCQVIQKGLDILLLKSSLICSNGAF